MCFFSKCSISFLASCIALCFIVGCSQKNDNTFLYIEPVDEPLDSTLTWLKRDTNFFKENYKPVLYNYYDQKIKLANYVLAAKSLELAAAKAGIYNQFDSLLTLTLNDFSEKYTTNIPAIKSSFINSYYGDYYTDKGENKKAIMYYRKAIPPTVVDYETCFKTGDSYLNIAWNYYCMGKQDSALTNNFKALAFFKLIDAKESIGSAYMYNSSIYQSRQDFINAEKNINQAIYYYSKTNNSQSVNLFTCLYNKINLYDLSNNVVKKNNLIDSVYDLYNKKNKNIPDIKVSIYSYKICKLIQEENLTVAKKLLDDLKPDVINSNSNITNEEYAICCAEYEIKQNYGIKDTTLILNAIASLMDNQAFARAIDLYAVLVKDAISKKNFERALRFEKQMNSAIDSVENIEMANKVVELNAKYETEKKEQQIVTHEKTITTRNTTIALLGALLIGFFLLLIIYTSKQKQKKLRQEKQNVQHYTKQLLEKTEEERKRIASDLHDSVSHELLSLKNSLEAKTDNTNTKIDTIINDIRSISRNLHPVMFDKIGLKAITEQLIERAQSDNDFLVTATINYTGTLSVTDELQLYRILQEALSNIIKYADAIAAKITIDEHQQSIYIEIKDNGKGFDVSKTLTGFNAFGLHNIIERSKAIGGVAKIVSDKTGTIITIEIPIIRK